MAFNIELLLNVGCRILDDNTDIIISAVSLKSTIEKQL